MSFNNDNKKHKNLKIVFLGSVKTGKSTFFKKIKGNKVDKDLEYYPTIAGAYTSHQIKFKHEIFQLDLWDVSGQERYYSLIKIYIIKADILFFFYNSYDISSFETAKRMVETFKENIDKNTKCVLIRSRYDECLETNNNKNFVSDEEALEFADLNNLYFAHLSNFEKNENANEFLKNFLKYFIN